MMIKYSFTLLIFILFTNGTQPRIAACLQLHSQESSYQQDSSVWYFFQCLLVNIFWIEFVEN